MNKLTVSIAILGATGAVGETLLTILEERKFPVDKLYLLASERSAGKTYRYGGRELKVQNVADFDFSQVQIGLFSAGGQVSAEYAPKAVAAGCLVIDNTSCFRYDDDVPLVVSEVNPEAIALANKRGIIANPNCSTMQMMVALKPIHDAVGIERINVATYQAVSGSGRRAVETLAKETAQLLSGQTVEPSTYPTQIAFNVLPHIDTFEDNGYTREEMKMVWETKKILGDDKIEVNPTAVRVPVFYGHSEAVHIETRQKITAAEVQQLLATAPGVKLMNDTQPGGYPTPVKEGNGTDGVYVGRIREDISHPRGINLWVVADNIRKGAALNAVQIAERWLEDTACS